MLDPTDRLRRSTYTGKEAKALKQELREELVSAKEEVFEGREKLRDPEQDFPHSPFQSEDGQKLVEAIAQIPVDALEGRQSHKKMNLLFPHMNQGDAEIPLTNENLLINYNGRLPLLPKELQFLRSNIIQVLEQWMNPSDGKTLQSLKAINFTYAFAQGDARFAMRLNPDALRFFQQNLNSPLTQKPPQPLDLKLLLEGNEISTTFRDAQLSGEKMEKWLNGEIIRTVYDLRERYPDKSPSEIGRSIFPQLGQKIETLDIIEIALLLVILQQQESVPTKDFDPDKLEAAVLSELKYFYEQNTFKGRPAPQSVAVIEKTILCTFKVPGVPLGRELSFHEIESRDAASSTDTHLVLTVKSNESSVVASVKKAQEAIGRKFTVMSEKLKADFGNAERPKEVLPKFQNYTWDDLAVYCVIRGKELKPPT